MQRGEQLRAAALYASCVCREFMFQVPRRAIPLPKVRGAVQEVGKIF